jgi:uncharacterized repeat protein (TIGR01451 family)
VGSFLAKFTPQGKRVYATLLPAYYSIHGIAVDGSGNAYTVGDDDLSGANFRQYSAIISKFDPTGTLLYHYSPDNGSPSCQAQDTGTGIVLNSSDTAAYVVGSGNPGFSCIPTTAGAYQQRGNGSGSGGMWVTKINVANNTVTPSLIYATYVGPSYRISPTGIAADSQGNAYVTGSVLIPLSAQDGTFPTSSGAFQKTSQGGNSDAFVTKVNANGTGLLYSIDADLSLTASPSPNPVRSGTNLTYTYTVTNQGPDDSDGATLTTVLPSNTTFVGFSNTNGSCSHPGVGSAGTFTCTRNSLLLIGHSWGPVTMTVKVNAPSGSTVTDTAHVSAKTQDTVSSNNTATVSVKVQ